MYVHVYCLFRIQKMCNTFLLSIQIFPKIFMDIANFDNFIGHSIAVEFLCHGFQDLLLIFSP